MTRFNIGSLIVFAICLFWVGYSVYGMVINRGLFHTDDFNYEYKLSVQQLTDEQITTIRKYLAQYNDIKIPVLINDYKRYSTPSIWSERLLDIPPNIPLEFVRDNYNAVLASAVCGVSIALGFFSLFGIWYKEDKS